MRYPTEGPAKHLRLVHLVWRQIGQPHRNDREDELQIAVLTICRIEERYQPAEGAFSTYALKSIRGAILDKRMKDHRWRGRRWSSPEKRRHFPLILFSEFGGDFVRGNAPDFATVEDHSNRIAEAEEVKVLFDKACRLIEEDSHTRDGKRLLDIFRRRNGLAPYRGEQTFDAIADSWGISGGRAAQIYQGLIFRLRRVKLLEA